MNFKIWVRLFQQFVLFLLFGHFLNQKGNSDMGMSGEINQMSDLLTAADMGMIIGQGMPMKMLHRCSLKKEERNKNPKQNEKPNVNVCQFARLVNLSSSPWHGGIHKKNMVQPKSTAVHKTPKHSPAVNLVALLCQSLRIQITFGWCVGRCIDSQQGCRQQRHNRKRYQWCDVAMSPSVDI